jgi:hypothetical protein
MGGQPKAGIDVCVINPGNTPVGCAKTDAQGYFWYAGSTAVNNGIAYVRYQTGATMRMAAPLAQGTGGGCSAGGSCHGGTQGRVYAP